MNGKDFDVVRGQNHHQQQQQRHEQDTIINILNKVKAVVTCPASSWTKYFTNLQNGFIEVLQMLWEMEKWNRECTEHEKWPDQYQLIFFHESILHRVPYDQRCHDKQEHKVNKN